MKSSQMTRYLD